jgi:hypothetical protein
MNSVAERLRKVGFTREQILSPLEQIAAHNKKVLEEKKERYRLDDGRWWARFGRYQEMIDAAWERRPSDRGWGCHVGPGDPDYQDRRRSMIWGERK